MSIWRSIHFVSFRFDLFRFVLFRFVSICFVSFRSVSFRFVSICFVSFRFVSVSFRTLQGPVQRLCLPYYCHFFWLASLASIIQTYFIYTYFQVQCSVLNGHPFSNIPLIQIMKRIQLPISCFYERAFSYSSRLKLHDFTPFKSKILWGRTPRPPPFHDTFTISKTTMSRDMRGCVERLSITKRPSPTENKFECK